MTNFNKLTPGETERLAILMEEAGEVIQAAGKILRHGWESRYKSGETNREQLETELGDLMAAVFRTMLVDGLDADRVEAAMDRKLSAENTFLHHQEPWSEE